MHVVEMEVILSYSIDKIWDYITNLDNQLWRRGIKSIEVIDENHFIEYDTSGYSTNFIITNKREPDIYEFDIENQNMHGHWVGKFMVINEKKVKVQLIESIEVHKKIMNIVVNLYLKKQQKQYIQDLQKALEMEL